MRGARILSTLLATVVAALAALVVIGSGVAAEADDQRIRVGTEGTYPPFTYHDPDTDQLTGYDVEVMRAVAREAGWSVSFTESTFDALFPALDADRIDTIANQVTINADRQAAYAFSEPYAYSHGVIVTRAGDDSITSLADLKGKTAAESATSNWHQVAQDAGAKVENVDQFAQAAQLLVQGRVDVIVNDNIAVLDYLAVSGNTDIEIAGDAGDEVSRQALVFRKDDAALARQATAAITALRDDGTLKEISEKYFKTDISVAEGGGAADLSSRADQGRNSRQVVEDTAGEMVKRAVIATIPLTIVSFLIGIVLALLVALARMSSSVLLWWPARAFISVIRGTPLLVQLFIVFYGLPELGLKLPSYPAAVLALSLNVAGYAAEIIRAAIASVPRGQWEAASTVGMDYRTTLRRIVLPQATRVAVPPLSNTFISLLKDTSLTSVVLVNDLFRVAVTAASESSRFLALYLLAAAMYWVICTVLSAGQQRLEKRFGRYVA